MTVFADEPDHYDRSFFGGWPSVRMDARAIAERVQEVVRRLSLVEPTCGELRPILATRAFRPEDPGPVLELATGQLAELIDRRARFDPPRRPAPVGPDGYSVVFGPNRRWSDPLRISLTVRAGQYREGSWDEVEL